MVGTRFGRNAPTDATAPEPLPERMEPSPREVANRLLLRDEFKPATSLNVLAACWIQFQNHDWFGHGENAPDTYIDIDARRERRVARGHADEGRATSPDRTRTGAERPAADLRQHRHPLVGRLADLRLDRGAQPRAALAARAAR